LNANSDRQWDEMLDEFRALGGTADNICLKQGAYGRGLFPRDPSRRIRVHIPEALLVDIKHVTIANGAARIDDAAGISERARQFLESYQRDFAWGVARQDIEDLLQMMHEAPAELRDVLDSPFNAEHWLVGPSEEATRDRFFWTRAIGYNGLRAVIPIVELANHGEGALYECGNGVGLSGRFHGEVLVRYNTCDPLDMFVHWGFPSPEPFAVSLQLGLKSDAGLLVVGRGDMLEMPDRRPFFPDVSIAGDQITLSYMMLGHKKYPRLARGIFYKIMRDAGRPRPEAAFDEIQHINRMQCFRLLELSELAAQPLGALLRRVARYQLEAMSHNVGTRDI
jgi:hypothetical protein